MRCVAAGGWESSVLRHAWCACGHDGRTFSMTVEVDAFARTSHVAQGGGAQASAAPLPRTHAGRTGRTPGLGEINYEGSRRNE